MELPVKKYDVARGMLRDGEVSHIRARAWHD